MPCHVPFPNNMLGNMPSFARSSGWCCVPHSLPALLPTAAFHSTRDTQQRPAHRCWWSRHDTGQSLIDGTALLLQHARRHAFAHASAFRNSCEFSKMILESCWRAAVASFAWYPTPAWMQKKAAELMIRCLQKFPTKLGTSRVTDRRVALAVKVFKPRYQLPPRSHEADWVGRHTALM